MLPKRKGPSDFVNFKINKIVEAWTATNGARLQLATEGKCLLGNSLAAGVQIVAQVPRQQGANASSLGMLFSSLCNSSLLPPAQIEEKIEVE